jgi:cytochrome P450
VVSRFDDIATSLTDKENLSNENNQSLLFAGLTDDERQQLCPLRPYFVQKDVIGSDPPDHTRVRALVQKAFTPKTILGLKPRICELAESMVVAHAGRGRQLDLTRDELLAACNTILTVGYESTINLIGSLVHLLLTHPE